MMTTDDEEKELGKVWLLEKTTVVTSDRCERKNMVAKSSFVLRPHTFSREMLTKSFTYYRLRAQNC